jgi:hypothetical protein
MEARATIRGASFPKSFVAAVLVLVAMGLAAMSGYVARSVFGGTAATLTSNTVSVHPAAGTILRQDNPKQAPAELPGWLQGEIATGSSGKIVVDDSNFYRQYLDTQTEERTPDHGVIP